MNQRTGSTSGRTAGVAPRPPHSPVVVDASWHGHHGIGRFATETLRRLAMPHRLAGDSIAPGSPGDVVAPWRLRLGRHAVTWTPGFNAGVTRARQVLTLHDLIHLHVGSESSLAKRAYYERLVRPAVRRAGAVLTVSATSRAAIREWIRDDAVDVVDVGNGVGDVFFDAPQASRSGGDLLYVGNLKPHKNPAPVFAALALLPAARLTVVTSDGDGVRALSRAHGVEDRVRAVAGCSDPQLRELYAGASALLMPSLLEGFGLPAAEALAVGTPVVHWTGCASVAEIVGGHGIAVEDAADPEAWADAAGAALDGRIRTGRPAGWADRWRWDGVAQRIDAAVGAVAERAR